MSIVNSPQSKRCDDVTLTGQLAAELWKLEDMKVELRYNKYNGDVIDYWLIKQEDGTTPIISTL